MRRQDRMKLGTFVYTSGFHPASWMHPGSAVGAANSFAHFLNVARISEAAAFDFMFMADSPAAAVGDPDALARQPNKMNRFEPLSLISALAVATEWLGLVATASTSYYEPYNLARIFASVDHLSGGRACWNVVTSDHDETGYNFNRRGLDPHALSYERAREFVEVCFGLWDRFEDDALLLDRETGLCHYRTKLHTLNHEGKHFQVRGPLNIARPPQGRPVIAQARLGGGNRARGRDRRTGVRPRLRHRPQPRLLRGAESPDAGFRPRARQPQGHAGDRGQCRTDRGRGSGQGGFPARQAAPDVGRLMLSEFLETDLRGVSLDAPFPLERLPETPKGSRALFEELTAFVRQGHSVGELIRLYAEKHTGNGITGTPQQIADALEEWFETRAADGFILMVPTLPSGLEDFVALVVPELRRRGLFRADYEGPTLRDNLGLARSVHPRSAAARAP